MQTITKLINTYSYNELSEVAQNKAMNDYIDFLLDTPYEKQTKNVQRAIDQAEAMQTPWFAGSYILDYAKEEILIFLSELRFLASGEEYYS